tara:strand:+ start:2379 stop:5783 length:3405 start_codon:yes stop_codon:yes gene_type:complete
MALILPSSSLNLPKAKLNTPDQPLNLPLNLPEIQQPKGFFETLRNPLDLMRYESLPVALFQGLSGNTKEVQAKKAQTFIEQNPNLKGSPEYLEAEAVLERYSYTLNDEPFSIDALKEAVKTNPGAMGGELVNAFMADPYLIFTPQFLGANALTKFYQANKILAKTPRLARGAAVGTIAVPEGAVYSAIMQLGEGKEFDTNRLAVESALGGAMGLGLGTAWGGSVNVLAKELGLEARIKRAIATDPRAKELFEKQKLSGGIPKGLTEFTEYMLKEWGENLKQSNVNAEAIEGIVKPLFKKSYDEIIANEANRTVLRTIAQQSKSPLVFGTTFGVGGYIASGEVEDAILTGTAVAGGVTTFKALSNFINRLDNIKRGTELKEAPVFNKFKDELKAMGYKPEDVGVKGSPDFYKDKTFFDNDLAILGKQQRYLDEYGKSLGVYVVRDAHNVTAVNNILANQLRHKFMKEYPIQDNKAVINFIQGRAKATDLNSSDLKAGKAAQQFFEQLYNKFLKDSPDFNVSFRYNYLPGFFRQSTLDTETTVVDKMLSMLTEDSKASSLRGKLAAEESKKIPSYDEGEAMGLQPRYNTVADIMKAYSEGIGKAVAQRKMAKNLTNAKVNGRNTKTGEQLNFMYFGKKPKDFEFEYVPIKHDTLIHMVPANKKIMDRINGAVERSAAPTKEKFKLRRQLIDDAYENGNRFGKLKKAYVYKPAAKSLQFLLDSNEEKGILRAVSNLNFLQKRLSVGYSFFHAAALMESMVFAGVGVTKALNVPISYFRGKQTSAKKTMLEGGNEDDYIIATKAGVMFSHPDDIGYHRFYDLLNNAQRIGDKIGGPFGKYLIGQGIDKLVVKPFKFIDDVTWDHVFNQGKLYTFQTARLQLLENPKAKSLSMDEINKRAAVFTNDAYGGLNWAQIYEDISNPILKKIAGAAYTPSGRRYMQLALFAPDWTTANLRILGRALPAANNDALSRKLYQAYAIRAGLIYATFGSALQYMFTGKSLLENKDPTKIDLGNGDTMVFSKQLMEPLHWAVHPYKTLVSKQGSTLKLTEQLLFNKKFLTSPYPSPISEEDLFSLYRARDYGQQIGESFIPFSFRTPIQQMMKDGVHFQDAINFLLGNFGHPVYPEGRQFKYPGLNIN